MYTSILAAQVSVSGIVSKIVNIIIDWSMSVGVDLVIAGLVLLAGIFVIKWVRKLVKKSFEKTKLEPTVAKFLSSLIKFVLYALLIVAIVGILGIPTSSFIAALSAAGLTIGLALQGSLSNFAGGVLILVFKPFVLGDYIKEDTHGNEGNVVGIDLFYTKLQTPDNKKIVVPNGVLANSSMTNFTAQKKRRVDIKIGVSYTSDIKLAKETLMNVMNSYDKVLKDEDMVVYIDELADSQVVIGTRAWSATEDYWTTKWDLTEQYKAALDAKGIEIPFNQLTVTIKDNK